MAKPLYGIFGSGGFGREGIVLAHESCSALHGAAEAFDLCFIEHAPVIRRIDGFPVYDLQEFKSKGAELYVNVLIAKPALRKNIVMECEALGLKPFTIKSRLAEIHPTARIGEGAVLCQFTIVSANATVGRHFHLNHHSYVSHDCIVGDFVTFAPAVHCNGTIKIGDMAYIGSGVVIRQGAPDRGMNIGAGATLGMGAVVLDSVPDGASVGGNPARALHLSGQSKLHPTKPPAG